MWVLRLEWAEEADKSPLHWHTMYVRGKKTSRKLAGVWFNAVDCREMQEVPEVAFPPPLEYFKWLTCGVCAGWGQGWGRAVEAVPGSPRGPEHPRTEHANWAVQSLLSDLRMLKCSLCCQVVQPLHCDLQIKSPIVWRTESFAEAFVQANRICIQAPGNLRTPWNFEMALKFSQNEILKLLSQADLLRSHRLLVLRTEYSQCK
jgi:hypothetical protein